AGAEVDHQQLMRSRMKRDAQKQLARARDLEHTAQVSAAIEYHHLARPTCSSHGKRRDEEIAMWTDGDAFGIRNSGGQGGEGFDVTAVPGLGNAENGGKAQRGRGATERSHHGPLLLC